MAQVQTGAMLRGPQWQLSTWAKQAVRNIMQSIGQEVLQGQK